MLREIGKFKTTPLDINQKMTNNPVFNTIKRVILGQMAASVQKNVVLLQTDNLIIRKLF